MTRNMNKTISEFFKAEKIPKDFIENHFEGSYYKSCQKFVKEKWDVALNRMTVRQSAWVFKILDDCVEKRIEG